MPSSIEDEQTFIDHAHSLLDQHIDHLRSRISNTTNAPSTGTGQDELEREALLDNLRLQLHAAEAARPRMCFGRLRFNGGDDHHIGRIGMRDEAGDVLLIDWRAPQAAPFYQATNKNPMDVVLRRRRLRSRGRRPPQRGLRHRPRGGPPVLAPPRHALPQPRASEHRVGARRDRDGSARLVWSRGYKKLWLPPVFFITPE